MWWYQNHYQDFYSLFPQWGNANPNCLFSRSGQDLDGWEREVFSDVEHLPLQSSHSPQTYPKSSNHCKLIVVNACLLEFYLVHFFVHLLNSTGRFDNRLIPQNERHYKLILELRNLRVKKIVHAGKHKVESWTSA